MPFRSVPTIRTAVLADVPALIALQSQIWEPTYRSILSQDQISYMFNRMYSAQALTEQLTDLGHTFFLAETEAGDLVGFASVGTTEKTGIFKLHKIYVLPQTHRSGIGRALLTAVERQVKTLGGQALRLNVHRANPARTFYERQGFQIIRQEDIPYGPYLLTDFIMELPINA